MFDQDTQSKKKNILHTMFFIEDICNENLRVNLRCRAPYVCGANLTNRELFPSLYEEVTVCDFFPYQVSGSDSNDLKKK